MDPAFIEGRTQAYTAASGAIIVVAVRAGKGRFLGFCRDNGRDVAALLHAPRANFLQCSGVTQGLKNPKKKSENHVLCWEGYGHSLLGL
jgi:hypothetical protein